MRIYGKRCNELRPQRHHDHKIQDVGELNTRQCKQKEAFLLLHFGCVGGVNQGLLYLDWLICHYQP